MTLSEKLKETRLEAGMSQEALAHACELSVSAIRDYERGKKEPSFRNMVKIADALSVGVEVFADAVRGPLPAHYRGRRRFSGVRVAAKGRLKGGGTFKRKGATSSEQADAASSDE